MLTLKLILALLFTVTPLPCLAGGRCEVFEDFADLDLADPILRQMVLRGCKGKACSTSEAGEILSQHQRSSRKKESFKSADALRRENEQVGSIVRDLHLSNSQRRQLHEEITGQSLSRQEVLERARDMFN